MSHLYIKVIEKVFKFRVMREIYINGGRYVLVSGGEVGSVNNIGSNIHIPGLKIFKELKLFVYCPPTNIIHTGSDYNNMRSISTRNMLCFPENFDELNNTIKGKTGDLGNAWEWEGYIDNQPKIFRELNPVTGMPEVLWPFTQHINPLESDLDRYTSRGGSVVYPLNIDLVFKFLLYSDCNLVVRNKYTEIFSRGEGDLIKIFDDGTTHHLEI